MLTRGNRSKRRLGLMVLTAAVATTLTACGFNDSLTRRGFIKSGDSICGQTVLKTAVALRAQGGVVVAPGPYLMRLGQAYADAARQVDALNVMEEDAAMRDRMVRGFDSTAAGLKRMAGHAASGGDIRAEATQVFTQAGMLLRPIRAYGFSECSQPLNQLPQ